MRSDKICPHCKHRILDQKEARIKCDKGKDMNSERWCSSYEPEQGKRE